MFKHTKVLVISSFLSCMFFSVFISGNEKLLPDATSLLKTIQQEAQELLWSKENLCPEELQLLLNFCCVTFAYIATEHKIQEEAAYILHCAYKMRYELDDFIESADELPTLDKTVSRFRNLLKARHSLLATFQELEEVIQQEENAHLAPIIAGISNHATRLITFAAYELINVKEVLTICTEQLDESSSNLHILNGVFRSLVDNQFPWQEDSDPVVGALDIAEQNIKSVITKDTKEIINMAESVHRATKKVQEFGALVFYIYFKAIYDGMKHRCYDSTYFQALFEDTCMLTANEKGLIAEPFVDSNFPFFQRNV